MSHSYFKTKYKEEVPSYGSCFEEEHTIYVHHNHSCDIVSFYNEQGEYILSYQDTVRNNIFDAMNKLSFPFKEKWSGEMLEGVETLSAEDFTILKGK